ncbi:patatin-like phospholipase family protein [candidate division WOR-3 bacterium]|nr:patatin-like phospholipase family protein [candidate division WOR-3 bacterium]
MRKIGLALGSGAARGFAHIGVLKVFDEEKIPIDFIAGTSIGALIGAIYASGISAREIEEIVLNLDRKKTTSLFTPTIPYSGLVEGKRITEFIKSIIGNPNIEDLKIPFAAIATDVMSGREVIFTKGSTVEAVRASISIPGIFTPCKYNGNFLADGGLVNPLPVNCVREMGADFIIAVNVLPSPEKGTYTLRIKSGEKKLPTFPITSKIVNTHLSQLLKPVKNVIENPFFTLTGKLKTIQESPSIFTIILQTTAIMGYQILSLQLKSSKPDVLIEPEVEGIKPLEFYRGKEGIVEGESAARLSLSRLRRNDR